MRSSIKLMTQILLDMLLVVFTTPFVFVFTYFFPLFFSGAEHLKLLKEILLLSLSVSWVSAAFLVAAVLILKVMIGREIRWIAIFFVSLAFGIIWILLYNWIILNIFTFFGSIIPLLLCCVFSTTYAAAKKLYNNDSLNFSDKSFYEESLNPDRFQMEEDVAVEKDDGDNVVDKGSPDLPE